jgi:hypothetical protein
MKLQKVTVELVLIFLVLCFIVVSVNTINSQDPINQTNNTTNSSNASSSISVQPLAAISITVTPNSLNLGTVLADNIERSYLSSTNVTVFGTGTGNLYVRAGGDFTQTGNVTNTISLANFKYDGFGNAGLAKTQLTTTNSLVNTFNIIYYNTVPVNYYLTVPYGTAPGNYNTTIIYSLIG